MESFAVKTKCLRWNSPVEGLGDTCIKNVIRIWVHGSCFHATMLTNRLI